MNNPKKKEQVQFLMQGNKVAVLTMEGDFLKLFKVSSHYQREMAEFLYENKYRVGKEVTANFPYLDAFV